MWGSAAGRYPLSAMSRDAGPTLPSLPPCGGWCGLQPPPLPQDEPTGNAIYH